MGVHVKALCTLSTHAEASVYSVLCTVARGPGGVRRHWGITVKDTPGAAGALCDARGAPHLGTAASW